MSLEKCKVDMSSGTWDPSRPCGRPVKEVIDGDAVCGVHARQIRHREERRKRWDQEYADSQRANQRRVELTRRLGVKVGHHDDPTLGVVSLDYLDNLRHQT